MHFRRIKGPSLARITPGTILKRAWQQLKKEVPPNRPKSDDSVLVKGPLVVTPPSNPSNDLSARAYHRRRRGGWKALRSHYQKVRQLPSPKSLHK